MVPAWRGWLLLFALAGVMLYVVLRATYPFLAVNDPRPGGLLVVEGWAPDYALLIHPTLAGLSSVHEIEGSTVTEFPLREVFFAISSAASKIA